MENLSKSHDGHDEKKHDDETKPAPGTGDSAAEKHVPHGGAAEKGEDIKK